MQNYGSSSLPADLEQLQAVYLHRQDEESGLALWQAVGKFADALQKAGRLADAGEQYLYCCELAEELVKKYQSDPAVRCLGISYDYLGTVFQTEGSLAEAESCFKRASEQFERLIYEDARKAVRKDVRGYTGCLTKLGKVYEDQRRFSEAQQAYLDGMAGRRELFFEGGQPADQLNLSFSYQCLAELAEAWGHPTQASLYYRQAMELQRQLLTRAGELPLPEKMLLPIFSDNVIGATVPLAMKQDYARARKYGEEALPLFRRMADLEGSVFNVRRLSALLELLGNACREMNDLNGAAVYYKECLETRNGLIRQVGETPELLDDLAMIHFNIALKETGNNRRLLLDRAEKIWAALGRQYPNMPIYQERVRMCRRNRLD